MKEFPKDWNYLSLGNICRSSQYGLNTPANGGKYPILGMRNLQAGKIDPRDLGYVDLSSEELAIFKLRFGDLLINRTNSVELVGKTALFDLPGDYVFASYLVRFVLNTDIASAEYVNYYCNSHIGVYQMQRLATKGVSQANINPTELKKNFYIPLPPIPEQRKIVEILSIWDDGIAKTEQVIAALQRRRKGLMQRLLTGDVRFPGFVISEKMKETKYGKVPSDWKSFHLEDVTFESRARAASENAVDLTVFGVNNQTGLTTDSKYSADNLDRYKVVRPGMFAYNPMRLNIGSIGYCDDLLGEGLVSPDYVVFGCKEDKLDSKYFSYCIQEHRWKNWVRRAGAGSVRVRIYYKDVSIYPIVLPTIFEQRKITEVLQGCDSEINLYTKKLEALRRQKKGLMQRLLTGQVRVNA
jgi:type I restriction enzyme S subunit